MAAVRASTRAAIVALLLAAPAVWYACTDHVADSTTGPMAAAQDTPVAVSNLLNAIVALRRHNDALLATTGVVGTAVTRLPDGRSGLLLLLERGDIAGLPQAVDGVPVTTRVTGRIMAFSDPTKRARPAPPGFSVGHPLITAGTIGARVRDAVGRVYILSNNHVLANSNGANLGDPEYQPGPYDGGTAADQIATLTDFQMIDFSSTGSNTIDAAIALSDTTVLSNATPLDDGYGVPNANVFDDSNHDGLFDDPNTLLGLNVQKYGRTTKLTHGQITGINATVTVCYQVSGFDCIKSARYTDQLIIAPNTFSGGGDSGSLIVTDDGNLNPVGLLFAGSSTVTIANRIDFVLARFGVTVDGFSPPPPGPLTDLAVTALGTPATAVQGTPATVTVTVKNFGNQDVTSPFNVTLQDTTDHVTVGTQSVAALTAGSGTTLTFSWTPVSTGSHVLVASQSLADDKPSNDRRYATVTVNPPVTDIAITSMTGGSVIVGHSINITVTVGNVGNQNVASTFTVTLRDTTGGSIIGAQTVSGLAAGASTSLTFTWNTTGDSIGGHTLVASHDLTDDVPANNQRSTVITVAPKPLDVAVTAISGPARVTQGDTAHILVTIGNVGEQDVTTSFNVVLTDGTAGNALLGTQTISGLVVGASTTLDFPWNTANADTTGHILFATSKLVDDVSSNNSAGIGIIVKPRPVVDVAVTALNAPASVLQGTTTPIAVTVQNVGGVNDSASFTVTLTDSTAGVTIGAQTVAPLAAGASASLSFNWNTTGASLGGHTLVATHSLSDGNSANNRRSTSVTVTAPITDVAVTSMSAPGSVAQGTSATVSVTVQNVGGQAVGTSFHVVLTDQTTGATIGTQTVAGLSSGASATLSFTWNTTGSPLGSNTLVGSHDLSDANSANNQRSSVVTVTVPPVDLALTAITGPPSVTQGDTAMISATVQNVGGVDVSTSFDVVLTDGSAGGVVIGTQTIPGLTAGASATRSFAWSTAGATTGGHILIATQKLPDNNSSNNAGGIGITVNPPSVHVGNLDGAAASNGNTWTATVAITVHDWHHTPLNGVTVSGSWNGSGQTVQCVTGSGGTTGICSVVLASIPNSTRFASFAVSNLAYPGYVYKSSMNHDPDGSSNGFSIYVQRK